MQRGFGGGAFAPVEERRDKEVTLGPAMLTGVGICLAVLCGACFLAGYAVGHHASAPAQSDASQALTTTPPAAPILNSQPKPTAAQAGAAQPISSDVQPPAAAENTTAENPGQVLPAALPGQPVSAAQPSSWMVQISEAFHPEDAEVLVDALRRRGYPASAHREPSDGLIHVRVGPFSSRDAAAASRQKLVSEGYNASVLP